MKILDRLLIPLLVCLLILSPTMVSCFVSHSRTTLASTRVARRMSEDESASRDKRPLPIRRAFLASAVLAGTQLLVAQAYSPSGFKRIPTQFIAALGNPTASSGNEAKDWGLWRVDPGPRGVFLKDFASLQKHGGVAPAGWKFDASDWWLEEHGLIMEPPAFPVPPGRYLVTGGRLVTTVLTVGSSGDWKLDDGKLYDVTHLPCRSARYKPTNEGGGSPAMANRGEFPVTPGAEMPKVEGCNKQDYAVLFVVGVEEASKDL